MKAFKRFGVVFASLALAGLFLCSSTGCSGILPEDYQRGQARWSTTFLGNDATLSEARFTKIYTQLLFITDKRDDLIKALAVENITESLREDIKIQRSIEFRRAQDQFEELEHFITRFEARIPVVKSNVQFWKFDPNNPDDASAFQNIEKAELAVLKLKERLKAANEAWTQYLRVSRCQEKSDRVHRKPKKSANIELAAEQESLVNNLSSEFRSLKRTKP